MAQGFVHAQERFFEMDIRRHVTAGGSPSCSARRPLETDRVIRTMGWRRVAEREWAVIEPRTRQALEAYADGVNAYLDSRGPSRLAVEYSLLQLGGLDYIPEPWTPVDSLAWLKAMAWDLRGNMTTRSAGCWPRSTTRRTRSRSSTRRTPSTTTRRSSGSGAVVDGVFDQAATGGTRNPERPPPSYDRAAAALERVQEALDAVPDLVGPR